MISDGFDQETKNKVFRIGGVFAIINGFLYAVLISYLIELPDWINSSEKPLLYLPAVIMIILGIALYYLSKKK